MLEAAVSEAKKGKCVVIVSPGRERADQLTELALRHEVPPSTFKQHILGEWIEPSEAEE